MWVDTSWPHLSIKHEVDTTYNLKWLGLLYFYLVTKLTVYELIFRLVGREKQTLSKSTKQVHDVGKKRTPWQMTKKKPYVFYVSRLNIKQV